MVRSRAGSFTDDPARLAEPIAVTDAGGRPTSWFVPQVELDRLVGFVELTTDLRHRRTSSFRRRPGTVAGCPPARSWLDPRVVAERALAEIEPGELIGEPVLSFDQVPDRLAWAVPVDGPNGTSIVYVAGDTAWRDVGAAGLGP